MTHKQAVREKERERERDRQTDRQTERQTERERERERQTDRQTETWASSEPDFETDNITRSQKFTRNDVRKRAHTARRPSLAVRCTCTLYRCVAHSRITSRCCPGIEHAVHSPQNSRRPGIQGIASLTFLGYWVSLCVCLQANLFARSLERH